MLSKNSKIFLAGHNGLVGGAILRKLIDRGYKNIITISKKKLDLRNQNKVFDFIKQKKPKFIIMPQLVLEELLPIIPTKLILFIIICLYKII